MKSHRTRAQACRHEHEPKDMGLRIELRLTILKYVSTSENVQKYRMTTSTKLMISVSAAEKADLDFTEEVKALCQKSQNIYWLQKDDEEICKM
ncbi:hypothetical protein chiPu_0019352 [Chiloscyllium punctatum]|uniref:Uncharacterized protein n=1 Tax=Chiloscyllium punctatum TaxID=137246 RepID=A0A401RRM3_CHIPU|nr:hypothetical protein [Chiloscyllium punctatum]